MHNWDKSIFEVVCDFLFLFHTPTLSPNLNCFYRREKNQNTYCKVASSKTSRLEAHAGFFQIAYDGDF